MACDLVRLLGEVRVTIFPFRQEVRSVLSTTVAKVAEQRGTSMDELAPSAYIII